MDVFEAMESNVRSYCRAFPAVFTKAKGALLYDEQGRRYIDFLSGAGTLNYGHNDDRLKRAIVEYLEANGVIQSLDLATSAKRTFLQLLKSVILEPRGVDYRVQFTGPTGANAVEAALKLARLIKKRANVVAFTNSYHGLSAGALAVTSNSAYRNEAFINRANRRLCRR